MKISNRVKRNISFTLTIVGVACIASRARDVAMSPSSGMAWFEFCGMMVITWCCYDNFRIYRRRVRKGILFGSEPLNLQ